LAVRLALFVLGVRAKKRTGVIGAGAFGALLGLFVPLACNILALSISTHAALSSFIAFLGLSPYRSYHAFNSHAAHCVLGSSNRIVCYRAGLPWGSYGGVMGGLSACARPILTEKKGGKKKVLFMLCINLEFMTIL